MLNNYSNPTRRIISALVAIPIVVVAIYWSVWSYFLLFLLIMVLTLREFYQLIRLQGAFPAQDLGHCNRDIDLRACIYVDPRVSTTPTSLCTHSSNGSYLLYSALQKD